jgi:hypothetical protein
LKAFAEIVNNTGFPLEFIPYLIRGGNDMFFQSLPSLSVIPAKLVLDTDRGAGIQVLIDNLSILGKQVIISETRKLYENKTKKGFMFFLQSSSIGRNIITRA